jgi:SpoVK/Ycf46/Vps4 family AAA+-type ATPase
LEVDLVKRVHEFQFKGQTALLSPGLREAPVLDCMCSHLVLTLAVRQGAKFNLRRDLGSLLAVSGRHLVWPLSVLQRLREYLARRCRGNEYWQGQEGLPDADFLQRFGQWRGMYEEGSLFFYLEDYARDVPRDVLALLDGTNEWLAHWLKKQSTLVEKNIDVLCGLLQLNKAERALLLYGTLARYQRDMRSLLVEFKVSNAPEAYNALAEVAGVKPQEIAEALRAGSRLERIGLVENLISEHNITDLADLMKVSEKLPPVLMREYQNEAELMAVFTRPCPVSALGPSDFEHVQQELKVMCRLLSQSVARREQGINVLLYGPPGTGKTELARVVARKAGLDLFEVEHADRDGNSLSGRDRYRSLQIAQVFLKNSDHAAMLFDEVEDVFPTVSEQAAQWMARADQMTRVTQNVNGKAWVNQILESNPVPTIWITNHIDQIDPAFRRRFAYHLELRSPPPGARERLVRQALQDTFADAAACSEAFVAKLVQRQGLTPAQIQSAARFAQLALEPGQSVEDLMQRQLCHADAALGQAQAQSLPAPTSFDLAMLNLQTRHDPARIIAALKAAGHGTLCFYGMPGTGKSALARHIADCLEKPLMIRKASDLVSKYVGETERNLAAMFEQARQEHAVLLLDEADSFLLSREGAQRHFEVTEVNEVLQQMESFDGILICTTNGMGRIDEAALRRFGFKIEFMPLGADQREAMFVRHALGGQHALLVDEHRQSLLQLDQLCLGDFAAVLRQMHILGETWSAAEFLRELKAEHQIKPQVRQRRPMGFTNR